MGPDAAAVAEVVARQPLPPGLGVVPGSTPVVSFGDPAGARVATLGLNPSRREFLRPDGTLLTGPDARLVSRTDLAVNDTVPLTVDQARTVVHACHDYFHTNPYRRWFDPLDRIVHAATGCGYDTGTACHLDLTPWATTSAWGAIRDPDTRAQLLAAGLPLLRSQLATPGIDLVVVNGGTVWRHLLDTGLVHDRPTRTPFRFAARNVPAELVHGTGSGVTFAGWTLNVQSSHGVRASDVTALGTWLHDTTRRRR